MTAPILEARGLKAFYGAVQVIYGVDFAVDEGGVTALLGANGAGKTTILRALSAMIRRRGQISFRGAPMVARALVMEPKLILLDEPAAGLNHEEVEDLGAEIKSIRDRRGVSVLLVEHHMNLVMRVSDHVVALDFGRRIAEGPPEAVRANPEVIRAYLGSAA